ncbi:50S ribosome-binding protein YggL [Enterovibrio paralichthyis]|uniref:50S ribosome-binding protein YggL n=1 Tax=Enterovibrio paralichthyis TaxID=2853805 RepID=UPI001C483278|nr:50S ribosome-binding protein YggL [Enterovibrio paralichthyis]MBV7298982.1 YggL family protein [Enterovibrio paralichthyis]
MPSQRSKRLRKKLYLDEFAVFGFLISLKLNTDSDDELDTFIESLADFAESRHLLVGGGGMSNIELVIGSALRYGSATEQDRESIKEWIEERNEVDLLELGPLVDLHQLEFMD